MATEAHIRSLYRSILRELPARKTFPAAPIRSSIREHFAATPSNSSPDYALARRQEAEQFIQYLKAQRTYGFLLERYNPGMGMDEEERVRLTAKRVGMELPIDTRGQKK
jgi:ATP synthase assembly factor FMC1, mitochondrial